MGQLFRRCATHAIYSHNGFGESGIQHIAEFAIGHLDAKVCRAAKTFAQPQQYVLMLDYTAVAFYVPCSTYFVGY